MPDNSTSFQKARIYRNLPRAMLHSVLRGAGVMAELAKVFEAEVRECVKPPVAPEVLDGIEHRRVPREALDQETASVSPNEVRDG